MRRGYSENRRLIGQEVAHYARSGAGYSGEQHDLITILANTLTDQDGARGLPVPAYGYSRKNFDKATKLVRRLRRLHTLPRRTR